MGRDRADARKARELEATVKKTVNFVELDKKYTAIKEELERLREPLSASIVTEQLDIALRTLEQSREAQGVVRETVRAAGAIKEETS